MTSTKSSKTAPKTPAKKSPSTPKKQPRQCTCGCGGTTKGGIFLPGHDARFVGLVARAVVAGELTEAAAEERMASVSDLLKAKIRRSIELGRTKAEAKAAKATPAE